MVTLLGRDLGACATPGKKTAIGAGGGAAVGAGIGALAGGGKGALIGAAIRGLTGGAIGNYLDKQEEELRQVAEARRTQNGILVNLKSSLLFFVAVGYPAWRTVAFTCVGLVGYGLYVLSRLPGSRLPRWGGTTTSRLAFYFACGVCSGGIHSPIIVAGLGPLTRIVQTGGAVRAAAVKRDVLRTPDATPDPRTRKQLGVASSELTRMEAILEEYLSFSRPLASLRPERLRLGGPRRPERVLQLVRELRAEQLELSGACQRLRRDLFACAGDLPDHRVEHARGEPRALRLNEQRRHEEEQHAQGVERVGDPRPHPRPRQHRHGEQAQRERAMCMMAGRAGPRS